MEKPTYAQATYGLLLILLGYFLNAAKGAVIKIFTAPTELTPVEYRTAMFFLICFGILILFTLGNLYLKRRKDKKVKIDLFPYYRDNELLEKTKYFVPTYWQNEPPSIKDDLNDRQITTLSQPAIPFFLEKGFKEKADERFYLILGGAGMGKSTFMINLYRQYLHQFSFNRKFNIVFLPFKNQDGLAKLEKMSFEEKQNSILLLDAFDEDPLAVEDYETRLVEVMKLVWDFRKVVITCRTQFFPNENEEPYDIPIPNPSGEGTFYFKKMYISPFSIEDCKKYIRRKFKFWNRKKRKKALRILTDAKQILVRPMILSRIDDLIESDRNFITTYDVYDEMVNMWVVRESNKRRLTKDKVEQYKKDLVTFSNEVALYIAETWKSKEKHHLRLNPDEIKNIASGRELSLKFKELTSNSLLNRDANGNWKFAHKSILEFLLVKIFLSPYEFKDRKIVNQYFELFSGMPFSKQLYSEKILKKHALFRKNSNKAEYVPYEKVKGDIYASIGLEFGGRDFFIVPELLMFEGLRVLGLRSTQVSDVSSLSSLVKLEILNLRSTQVSDVSSLSSLVNLRWLYLRSTQVSDVSSLSSLVNLSWLDLRSTQVSDVSSLSSLVKLESLDLRSTQVSDVSSLSSLVKLESLDLRSTQVSDVSSLSSLVKLERLDLSSTQVSDVSSLSSLVKLERLDLSSTQVSDVSSLSSLVNLKELSLSSTQVSDVSSLSHIKELSIIR